MNKPTKHQIKIANEAVDRFNVNDNLWHNTKLMEDNKTYQIRIWDALRVQFQIQEDWEKEIKDIFLKTNHKSHR